MSRSTQLASPFRVLPLARLAKGGRWRTEAMRSYGAPVLLWFARGQGRITVNGKTQGYNSHNLVYIPAGTMHGFEMNATVQGSIVVFPVGVEEELGLPEDPVHLRISDTDSQLELVRIIDALQAELEGPNPARERALMAHAGLLSVWIERQMGGTEIEEQDGDAASRLAAAYTALVEKDFHSAKTVRDYAKVLGVTPTHLSRVCNKACGRPASAILADRVHYEARRLLTETHMPVKDIAAALGFASPAYFTRAFAQHTGRTPTTFRRGG